MKKHCHIWVICCSDNNILFLNGHRRAAFTIWQCSQALSWEVSEAPAAPMPWVCLHSLMCTCTCHRDIDSRFLTWLSQLPVAHFCYIGYSQTTHTNPVFLLWTFLPKPKLGPVVLEYPLQPICFSTSCCLCFLPVFPVQGLTNSLLECQEKCIFVNLPQTSKKLKTGC